VLSENFLEAKMKTIILTIFTLFSICLTFGCNSVPSSDVKNSEKYATETRSDFGFREIKAGNAAILIVTVGEPFNVTVEGEENLLKDVKTATEGETLIITTRGKITRDNKIRLKISMPELNSLELWGATEATVSNVKSDALKLQVGGSSTLKIDGAAKTLTANIGGESKVDAENLRTEKTEVRTAGTSELIVFAADELIAETVGASMVYYLGEPKNIKQSGAGAGEIRKK
jgi:Putative auto-transporter adhesin, head GIN domain